MYQQPDVRDEVPREVKRIKKKKWNQVPESSNRFERFAHNDRAQICEVLTNAAIARKILDRQMGTLPLGERRDAVGRSGCLKLKLVPVRGQS